MDLPTALWGRYVEFGDEILDRRHVRARGNQHQTIRTSVRNDTHTALGALASRGLGRASDTRHWRLCRRLSRLRGSFRRRSCRFRTSTHG